MGFLSKEKIMRAIAAARFEIVHFGPAWIMQITARRLLGMIFLLALAADAFSAEGAGTVKTLTGSATLIRESAVLPVSTGQRVYRGDRILSARDSYVGIMLYDDTRLTLGPVSELEIREFEFNSSSYAGDLAVSFLKGTVRVVTGLIGKNAPENVQFSTPTASIGVRGTEFVVDVESQ
jgi:hypothetical protein